MERPINRENTFFMLYLGPFFSHVEMGIPLMVQVKMGNCFLQEMVEEASIAPRVPA